MSDHAVHHSQHDASSLTDFTLDCRRRGALRRSWTRQQLCCSHSLKFLHTFTHFVDHYSGPDRAVSLVRDCVSLRVNNSNFLTILRVFKNIPDISGCNSNKRCLILMICGRNVSQKVGNQKVASCFRFTHQLVLLLCYTCKTLKSSVLLCVLYTVYV